MLKTQEPEEMETTDLLREYVRDVTPGSVREIWALRGHVPHHEQVEWAARRQAVEAEINRRIPRPGKEKP